MLCTDSSKESGPCDLPVSHRPGLNPRMHQIYFMQTNEVIIALTRFFLGFLTRQIRYGQAVSRWRSTIGFYTALEKTYNSSAPTSDSAG
jgi:hypothetical protein